MFALFSQELTKKQDNSVLCLLGSADTYLLEFTRRSLPIADGARQNGFPVHFC